MPRQENKKTSSSAAISFEVMVMNEKELPKRKPTRLQCFDYSSAGAYFITICTHNRHKILSHIVGGDVLDAPGKAELSSHGKLRKNISSGWIAFTMI